MLWPFAGRDGMDSRPREAPGGPVPLTVTPSKGKSEQLRGKGVEGHRRRGPAKTEAKAPSSPLGMGEKPPPRASLM